MCFKAAPRKELTMNIIMCTQFEILFKYDIQNTQSSMLLFFIFSFFRNSLRTSNIVVLFETQINGFMVKGPRRDEGNKKKISRRNQTKVTGSTKPKLYHYQILCSIQFPFLHSVNAVVMCAFLKLSMLLIHIIAFETHS